MLALIFFVYPVLMHLSPDLAYIRGTSKTWLSFYVLYVQQNKIAYKMLNAIITSSF